MNTNLSNGVEYLNPSFKKEFAEYLLQNKWRVTFSKNSLIFFIKQNKQVRVMNDCIDFFLLVPSETSPSESQYQFQGSVTGISTLSDLNMFILVLHAMNIQDLREFQMNAAAIDLQHGHEARMILKEMFFQLQNIPVHGA